MFCTYLIADGGFALSSFAVTKVGERSGLKFEIKLALKFAFKMEVEFGCNTAIKTFIFDNF
jgi:hypothetical protein